VDWPDLTLAVVGGSGRVFASGDVKDQAMPNLKYLGYVKDTDLAVLYSNAEIFIYPSLYEGFGIPPLEAMAAGCPVAVARSSSLPEVCGGAAEYFDPKNQSDLILAVRRLLNFDETKRLCRQEQGKDQAQIYTQSRQQLQWLKVCRSIGIKVDRTDY
jgi:glycosyltransferase involved in cell wall biosynthesis